MKTHLLNEGQVLFYPFYYSISFAPFSSILSFSPSYFFFSHSSACVPPFISLSSLPSSVLSPFFHLASLLPSFHPFFSPIPFLLSILGQTIFPFFSLLLTLSLALPSFTHLYYSFNTHVCSYIFFSFSLAPFRRPS